MAQISVNITQPRGGKAITSLLLRDRTVYIGVMFVAFSDV